MPLEDVVTQATGGILGLMTAGMNDHRQIEQQKKLQALQIAGNKEMGLYNYDLQKRMWDETNYEAQRKHLEAAGLNPGLLYGMSGGGGTTTGSGSGAGVTGGDAPKGGGEVMMGIQMGMQQAQLDLIRAQTEKTKADTAKTTGVDTQEGETRIASAKAQQELTKIQTSTAEIENEIKGATQNAAKALIMQELRSSYEKLQMLKNERTISDATVNEHIKIIQQTAIGAYLKNALTKAQTTNTTQDTQNKIQTLINDQQKWKTMLSELTMAWNRDGRDAARLILQQTGATDDQFMGNILDAIEGIMKIK